MLFINLGYRCMEHINVAMTPILIEDLGMRYSTSRSKEKKRYGLYRCQYCGTEFISKTQSVKNRHTQSCGCYKLLQSVKVNTTHNYSNHVLYLTWNGMKQRCYNTNSIKYKDYGGRGIKVCDRWLDISNFIEDMYPSYLKGLSLDRIDVNGIYEPDNCRWTTKTNQSRNTRDIQINNTSGYRGVTWSKHQEKWISKIRVYYDRVQLGSFNTALEAAKAYERYVRLNNLEHNFTPALTEEEIKELYNRG